jgi:predicted RNA-binding Zn-ribbon protein involved in translation (DUF1610 family)
MAARDLIKKQFSIVLVGLAAGLALGLAGLFWLDSRTLLLSGMGVLAIAIFMGERVIRCPTCGQSVYAEIAREAAFTPSGVPRSCPKCQADWTKSAVDWTKSAKDGAAPTHRAPSDDNSS